MQKKQDSCGPRDKGSGKMSDVEFRHMIYIKNGERKTWKIFLGLYDEARELTCSEEWR